MNIFEILSLNPNIPEEWEIIDREYNAVNIEKVIIDGDTFTNYGDFQFIWEKTYATPPTRSVAGNMGDLNSYVTFITPHLLIDFSIMSIDDYRKLIRKDIERNEFVVQSYDFIYNKQIKVKMYLATQDMVKLHTIARKRLNNNVWEDWIEIVGVRDYSVELIGTNNDLDLKSVRYIVNSPKDDEGNNLIPDFATDGGEEDVYRGEDLLIGGNTDIPTETFSGRYKFTKWNLSASGGDTGNYINGYVYTINDDLILYAQWEKVEDNTLTFNYGVVDNSENTYENSRTVVKGKSVGKLPKPTLPSVICDNVEYYPYYNGGWYKTAEKAPNSIALQDDTLYWSDYDSSIYLIYDKYSYTVTYYVDNEIHSTDNVIFNEKLPLPQLVKDGYTFSGWYYKANFGASDTKASGKMPPYNLSLYAKWVKK